MNGANGLRWPGLAAALLCLSVASSALADGLLLRGALLPAYAQECSACHLAYPPGLLPAASWQRLMQGLDQHYGSDASLDPATVQQISTWLQSQAGTYKRVTQVPAQDRITRSAWFERKHRKLTANVWSRPAIRSAANCAACHSQAAQDNYDDDLVRIPK